MFSLFKLSFGEVGIRRLSKQQVYDDRDKMQTNFEANKTTISIQTTKFVPPNIKGKKYFPINFIKPASF